MASYFKKAFWSSVISLILSFLAGGTSYITRIILARNLQPAELGLFYAVFTFVIFFLFFRDLGLGQALVRYIAELEVHKRYDDIKTAIISVLTIQFASSAVFGIIFFFLADYLSQYYFKDPAAALILKILVIYVLSSILFIVAKNVLQGFQKITLFSSMEFVKNLIVLILIVFFSYLGFKILAPVLAFAMVNIILFLIYLPYVLKRFPFFQQKTIQFKETSQKMLLMGLPFFVTAIGDKVIAYIDTLMLTYFSTLTEVGIYNVVLPSAIIFLDIGGAIATVVFPMSSELWAKGDTKRLIKGVHLMHRYTFILAIPPLAALFIFSEFFLTLFFGKEYAVGALAFQILLVGVLFFLVAFINNNVLSGIGKPKIVTKMILIGAAANALLNIVFIPVYGIAGAAFATSFSYFLILLLSTSKVIYYIQAPRPYKDWIKLTIPAATFVGVIYLSQKHLYFAPWIKLLVSFPAAIMIYFLQLYLFNLINLRELKYYFMQLRKKDLPPPKQYANP